MARDEARIKANRREIARLLHDHELDNLKSWGYRELANRLNDDPDFQKKLKQAKTFYEDAKKRAKKRRDYARKKLKRMM
jgi:hypothetical protein